MRVSLLKPYYSYTLAARPFATHFHPHSSYLFDVIVSYLLSLMPCVFSREGLSSARCL